MTENARDGAGMAIPDLADFQAQYKAGYEQAKRDVIAMCGYAAQMADSIDAARIAAAVSVLKPEEST